MPPPFLLSSLAQHVRHAVLDQRRRLGRRPRAGEEGGDLLDHKVPDRFVDADIHIEAVYDPVELGGGFGRDVSYRDSHAFDEIHARHRLIAHRLLGELRSGLSVDRKRARRRLRLLAEEEADKPGASVYILRRRADGDLLLGAVPTRI